jgi:hypothetical protein
MAPTSAPTQPTTPTIDIQAIPINHFFTDDTGRFTPRARSGNQYVMVALHSESNAILVRPFQSKHDSHRIAAYNDLYSRLVTHHATPDVHILDNEASKAFLQAITNNGCKYQLVPPHVHRRNRAERAIRTFKDHFIAILAGVAPTFPRDRWDLLLPHAELTLNLLRPSNNPSRSAWDSLFGPYNFDATPMGPAGCRVLIHTKATIRRSWENRCHDGFYLGPALQHYRCYRVLNAHSGAVTISDAIKFRHHYLPSPELTPEDKLLHAVQAINSTIARSTSTSNDEQLAAIEALREILHSYNRKQPTQLHPLPGVPLPGVPPPTPHQRPGVPTITPTPAPTPTQPAEWSVVPHRHRTRPPTPAPSEPIAQRTRSRMQNAFAALAVEDDDSVDDGNGAYNETHIATMPAAYPVLDASTGQQLEHRQLRRHPAYKQVWDTSYANELGRLCQGIGHDDATATKQRVEGTDTFRPIHYDDIPTDRRSDVTYTRVVCEVRPQKEDPNRTRITIGGNRICYPGDT